MKNSLDPVLHTRDERGVHRLTLNRADSFNTLSEEMLTALQAALDAVVASQASCGVNGIDVGLFCATSQLAGQVMACNRVHAVVQEGVQAFIDKRKPQWPAPTP
jgi:enoyl-CoA hydratase/carnithine racemase